MESPRGLEKDRKVRHLAGGSGAGRWPERGHLVEPGGRTEQSCGLSGWQSIEAVHAGSPKRGPGLGPDLAPARAWVEHRSMLQPYQGPIRHAWTLAGIADALAEGETDRARSIAMLGLAALDQAAVDSGSWRRWSPVRPFGRLPEPGPWRTFESRQTKLLDPRWMSVLMGRIRERDRLSYGKRRTWEVLEAPHLVEAEAARIQNRGDRGDAPSGGDAPGEAKGKKGSKGSGRGDKANKKGEEK